MKLSIFWYVDGVKKASGKDALVIVDATRFSGTVSTALALGIEKVIPIAKVEDYVKYVDDRSGFVLALEYDDSRRPPYADIGNSPGGLLKMRSEGKLEGRTTMIIRSSSGSHLLSTARSLKLKNVLIGSFLNAKAVARYLVKEGFEDAAILCAGYKRSSFALDDYLAAGCIVSEILKLKPDVEMDEELLGAYLAYEGVLKLGISIGELILTKLKVRRDLERVGETDDAYIISQVNRYDVVPKLVGEYVVDALKQK